MKKLELQIGQKFNIGLFYHYQILRVKKGKDIIRVNVIAER
jgi:hypothetical protein